MQANVSPALSVTETTLAHFSDPHLSHEPRLRLRERLSKRQLSAWSWQGSRRELQLGGVLEALLADLREHRPDQIVVTGDITNFSLADEFEAAQAWLQTLGAPGDVSVVPGNHDALVAIDDAQGLGRWRPWMCADPDRPATPQWPYVRVRGEIALIGLNSALPTLPLLASGKVGDDQLERLDQFLCELGARGLFRIVLLHHPVADGAVSARKALRNRAALRAVLARAGAELVLHGHARDARFDTIAGPAGSILCLGLPSSSAVPNSKDAGARWHHLSVRRVDAGAWRLQVNARLWDAQSRGFVRGGGYAVRIERAAAQ
ncbi:MAG: Metallophosphoesterase [Nevskia sp.]|nr:Metallophosphoesterase [Nevskia sp.]